MKTNKRRITQTLYIALVALGIASYAHAAFTPFPAQSSEAEVNQTVRFPRDAGVIDITQPPYNAKGDGKTDDTVAIQKAITEHVRQTSGNHKIFTLYFPNGTYLVSDTLVYKNLDGKWSGMIVLQGETRNGTVIKLKDETSAYGEGKERKAVLMVACPTAWGGQPVGNDGMKNYVKNMTIDTGKGNPAAIGLDYLGHNDAGIMNVTIRSGDGQGEIGLAMNRILNGPLLVKNMLIDGFKIGVHIHMSWYPQTFEYLHLRNQTEVGIFHELSTAKSGEHNGSVITMRRVTSENSVPLFRSIDPNDLFILFDGNLTGGAGGAAIDTIGRLYLRNVKAEGFRAVLDYRGLPGTKTYIDEFVSDPTLTAFESRHSALHLPVKETPFYEDNDFNNWANVEDYGAVQGDNEDDTAAIQRALDSGKSTIYFPQSGKDVKGGYTMAGTVHVRKSVRRILGLESSIWLQHAHPKGDAVPDEYDDYIPAFLVDETEDTLFMEGVNPKGTWFGYGMISIRHASPASLVIRNSDAQYYDNMPGAGDLFLECLAHTRIINFRYPQNVWARQLNSEHTEPPKVVNNGGKVWILGLKCESPSPLVENLNGGQVELIGGYASMSKWNPKALPGLINVDASMSAPFSLVARGIEPERSFYTFVRDVRDGEKRFVTRTDAYPRPMNKLDGCVPLFTSYSENVNESQGKNMPYVRVKATSSSVYEGQETQIRVIRTGGDMSQAFQVELAIEGEATDADYEGLTKSVTIPEGEKETTMTLATKTDEDDEGLERVIIRALPDDAYGLIVPYHESTVSIVDGTKRAIPKDDLVLHLAADGLLDIQSPDWVGTIFDLSGNGNDAKEIHRTDRRPHWERDAINGRPAFRMNGSRMRLPRSESLAGGVYEAKTLVLVIQTGDNTKDIAQIFQQGATARGFRFYLENDYLYFSMWNTRDDDDTTPWGPLHIKTPIKPNTAYVVTAVFDSKSGMITGTCNGKPFETSASGAGKLHAHIGAQGILGLSYTFDVYHRKIEQLLGRPERYGWMFYIGDLAELLQYNRAFSTEEVASTSATLMKKYGISGK